MTDTFRRIIKHKLINNNVTKFSFTFLLILITNFFWQRFYSDIIMFIFLATYIVCIKKFHYKCKTTLFFSLLVIVFMFFEYITRQDTERGAIILFFLLIIATIQSLNE